MSEFNTHLYSGRTYTSDETIYFNPRIAIADFDREMQLRMGVSHVQASGLSQEEFDLFVNKYADNYKSIYFFQNTKIKDLSALSKLKNVEYLLFYNLRGAKALWDMSGNVSLKGLLITESKNLIYDLSLLQSAPLLEEVLLFSNMNRKYIVKSVEPLKHCLKLKRAFIVFNTEQGDFNPEDFSSLEVFKYQVDRKRNFTY